MAEDSLRHFDMRRIERLERADKVAKKDSCIAANVHEFENAHRARMIARSLGSPDQIDEVVVENATKKRLKKAGVLDDPVDEQLHRHFFMLADISPRVYAIMMRNGLDGCKALGSLADRMSRTLLNYGDSIQKGRAKRNDDQRTGPALSTNSSSEHDPEAEDAKYLEDYDRARRAAQLAGARRQFEEEKAVWAALSPEVQAEYIRYEKEHMAWSKDFSVETRPPDVGDEYYDFDYLPHLALEHFTDDERERSLQPPEPEKPELEPPQDGAGYDLATFEDQPAPCQTREAAAAVTLVDPGAESSVPSLIIESARHWEEHLNLERRFADADISIRRIYHDTFELDPQLELA